MDLLKGLDLRRWWIAAIAVGLAITVAAIAAKDHGNILIGLGIGACGFGDWMKHRMETKIKTGGTLTTVILTGLRYWREELSK